MIDCFIFTAIYTVYTHIMHILFRSAGLFERFKYKTTVGTEQTMKADAATCILGDFSFCRGKSGGGEVCMATFTGDKRRLE